MADRSVVYRFMGRFDNLTSGLAAAGRSVEEFGDTLLGTGRQSEEMRAAFDEVAGAAGAMGLAAAAGVGVITKAAMDWESAWAGVTKTVDGSASEMAILERGLRDLTKILPTSHAEIAGVAEAAGQLGVARGDIIDFTEVMINLGETTNLTADDAATAIAQISNVMGTASEDIGRFGATLVALGNDGASTEAEILAMTQRLAGGGKLIGASEGEVLALANAMASMGIEAELGGGAMSRMMVKVFGAVKTGGAGLERFAAVAGTSAEDFAERFAGSPVEAIDSVIQGLNRIDESGGNAIAALDSLGIKGTGDLQVLLRMKGAGDLLAQSLDLQAQAWGENNALTEEAEKRYETTEARITLAWNQIQDAAIEAGGVMLPVVAGIADTVADLAGTFEDLPGPVKAAVGPLLSTVAIVGGGLWFTSKAIAGVTSMGAALRTLGLISTTTNGQLLTVRNQAAGIARGAAGIAGAAMIATGANNAFFGANAAAGALMGTMISPGWGTAIGGGIGLAVDVVGLLKGGTDEATISLENYMQTLKNSGPAQESLATLLGSIGKDDLATLEAAGFAVDEILNAAMSGETHEQVANLMYMFDNFDGKIKGTEFDSELVKLATAIDVARDGHEKYGDAVEGSERATALLGDETAALADSTTLLTQATGESVVVSKEQAKALEDARKAARDAASGFFSMSEGINDAEVSLSQWIENMEAGEQALRDFRLNSKKAAKEGLDDGLIASLQDAGTEGALRMEQLANGTDAEIDRANRAWRRGQREIQRYEEFVTGIQDPNIDVTLNMTQAERDALRLKRQIDTLTDKTVDIRVVTTYSTQGNKNRNDPFGPGAPGAANGDTVPKTGLPYADRHPYLLADGEEVVSNRYGQADRHRPLLKAISANRLADGGTVGFLADGGTTKNKGSKGSGSPFDGAIIANSALGFLGATTSLLTATIRTQEKALGRANTALDKETATRDSVQGMWNDLASTVGDKFKSSIFGEEKSPFDPRSLGVVDTLKADTVSMNSMLNLIPKLKDQGLSGDALKELLAAGNLQEMQAMANNGGLASGYQKSFDTREAFAQALGAASGGAVYGERLAAANVSVAAIESQVSLMTSTLKALEKSLGRAEKQADRAAEQRREAARDRKAAAKQRDKISRDQQAALSGAASKGKGNGRG